ncbi:MAG TPA: hypothetical protein EYG03_08155 [Planctomycetes bacterium]|nr:hypothetical protein [Planctomycetota bacterium]
MSTQTIASPRITWEQDYEQRVNPKLMTGLLRSSIPVLEHSDWRIEKVEDGFCQSVLPLNSPTTNQHGTHQAALISLSADYTGGLALESLGSLFWNPASISALPEDEMSIGLAASLPVLHTDSFVPGLGGGSSRAEPGVTPLPNVGLVHRPMDSATTFGLGIFSAAGFRTNFPASLTNPVFTPQSNTVGVPGGLGQVYTEAAFLQVIPTVSWQVTNSTSVGVGPTITLGDMTIAPFVFNAPNDADGSGAPRYSSGHGTRTHWGAGVQAGVYYKGLDYWHLGADRQESSVDGNVSVQHRRRTGTSRKTDVGSGPSHGDFCGHSVVRLGRIGYCHGHTLLRL